MVEFEVWIYMPNGKEKVAIEAVDLRAASAQVHEIYRGCHEGFFIMPCRRPGGDRALSRRLPFDGRGRLDYGANQEAAGHPEGITRPV